MIRNNYKARGKVKGKAINNFQIIPKYSKGKFRKNESYEASTKKVIDSFFTFQ